MKTFGPRDEVLRKLAEGAQQVSKAGQPAKTPARPSPGPMQTGAVFNGRMAGAGPRAAMPPAALPANAAPADPAGEAPTPERSAG